MSTIRICERYNPYFKSGCDWSCGYEHLVEPVYIKHCAKMNAKNPPNITARKAYDNALKQFNHKNYESAIRIFIQLLLDYPFHDIYHSAIARCYEKSDLALANYHHRQAIAINPTNPIYHVNYANFSYLKWADYKTAKCHFEKALEFDDKDSVTHGMFAKYLHNIEHNWIRAEYHLKQSLSLNQTDERAYYQYALLLYKMNKYKESKSCFQKCIKLNTQQGNKPLAWHHYNYGLVLKELREYETALNEFLCALKIRPFVAEMNFEYGLLLCGYKRNYYEGLKYLDKACQYNTNSQDNDYYLKQYNHYKSLANDDVKSVSNLSSSSTTSSVKRRKMVTSNRAQPPPPILRTTGKENKIPNDTQLTQHKVAKNISISLNKNLSDKIRNVSCENEFRRFLVGAIFNNELCNKYYLRCKELSFNDIRLLEHFDSEILKNDIGINNKLHIKMFEKKIERFKEEMKKFESWLVSIECDDYCDIFESNGIVTFESFYYYLKSWHDIAYIIGTKNETDAKYIWLCMETLSKMNSVDKEGQITPLN